MTKKRIADLLKEEVEKTNDPDQTSAKSASQQPQTDTEAVSTSSKKPASTSTNRTRKRATTNKSGSTTDAKKSLTAASSTGLEKQVADLETALKQAKEQIAALQKDIETHQARIFELKDELTASNEATANKAEELTKTIQELETAKETIRKITAAQEEETLPKDETPQKIIHGADLATNRNTLSLRSRPSSYKAIPEYAIQRGEQNSMLSDDDIGWVD